jgi:uncharacterized membrane protein YbaN (DUF454 family)
MEQMQDVNRLSAPIRWALIAFGFLNVAIGLLGVILPGLPTTPFLLVALWAFARSSQRFHDWLYSHPKLGPSLRAWRDHRVVPKRAKVLALATMATSLAYVVYFHDEYAMLPIIMATIMVPTAIWLVSRDSQTPETE